MLRHSLHSEPRVVCHGEVLSRQWINGLVPLDDPEADRSSKNQINALLPLREKDFAAFLEAHVWPFPDHHVGFKLIFEDLFLSKNKEAYLNYFSKLPNLKVGILWRRNALAAITSVTRMAQHKITHEPGKSQIGAEKIGRVTLEPARVKSFKVRQLKYVENLKLEFPNAFFSTYESLIEDYPNLLRYLEISETGKLTEKLSKTGSVQLRDMIENYKDVAQYDEEL